MRDATSAAAAALITSLLFSGGLARSEQAPSGGLQVRTYASQVKDVDSVNSHWFETEDGVVLVDAQRLLPEAERALEHLRATTDKPIKAIVVTHAHTDHYGGLPVWRAAFPSARIYTDSTTLNSIRTDGRGFIAARVKRHGERFATHEQLKRTITDAITIQDGERVKIDEASLTFTLLGRSEAESTVVMSVEGHEVAFIGDLINVGAPAVPFESIDNWLSQLNLISARFAPRYRLYQGHGPAPVTVADVEEQRRFLNALRKGVADALVADVTLTIVEIDRIVLDLEAGWPFYEGVAGNTRREILAFAARQVATQLGGRIDAEGG